MERPIMFSAPMVRAILAGTKTQTRRVLKQVQIRSAGMPEPEWRSVHTLCPYGQPGDRLWVRESWRAFAAFNRTPPRDITAGPVWHEARDDVAFHPTAYGTLRPSIHMPRWASRITLEVTGVRVERLQDISEADAIAEGIEHAAVPGWWRLYGRDTSGDMDRSPRVSYHSLWESINGPGSWDANPWVWVVEFKRVV